MNDHAKDLALKIGVGIVVLFFTLFGFVIKQDCDIDKVYLWCRLHPLKIADIIGLICFYGGAAVLAGFVKNLINPEHSAKWNWISFAILAFGLIVVWAA
jgi:hypothetical protein